MVPAINLRTDNVICSLGCLCLRGLRLDTLLHGIQVGKFIGILAQAPSHDTAKLLLRDNILELAGNQVRGIPSPEDVVLLVEVVLAAVLLVGLTILLSLAPRIDDGNTLAGAVIRKAASLAEVITSTAIYLSIFKNEVGTEEKEPSTNQLP